MAISFKDVKTDLKYDLNLGLIDLKGNVDSKGNYIYLSGFKKPSFKINEFEFTLLLASMTFCGCDDSLEDTLDALLSRFPDMIFSNKYKDISISSIRLIKRDSLFIYECKLNVVIDQTKG